MPAFTNQKLLNPSVSIASVTAGKFNGLLSQFFVEFTLPGFIPLACPVPVKAENRLSFVRPDASCELFLWPCAS